MLINSLGQPVLWKKSITGLLNIKSNNNKDDFINHTPGELMIMTGYTCRLFLHWYLILFSCYSERPYNVILVTPVFVWICLFLLSDCSLIVKVVRMQSVIGTIWLRYRGLSIKKQSKYVARDSDFLEVHMTHLSCSGKNEIKSSVLWLWNTC